MIVLLVSPDAPLDNPFKEAVPILLFFLPTNSKTVSIYGMKLITSLFH